MISLPSDTPPLPADSPLNKPIVLRTNAHSPVWRFHDEYVLGTRMEMLVNARSIEAARHAANAARGEIARLDNIFSRWIADSELSQLNRKRRGEIGIDTYAVIDAAEQWRRITRGAFDGRMGRLLKLWQNNAAPSPDAISRELCNLRKATSILGAGRRLSLSPEIELSLDAIAKGYIVDAALNAARRASPGIAGMAINIGGDIRCWGESPECRGWRIGIADPMRAEDNAPLIDAITVNNAAIATSGRGPRDLVGHCLDGALRSTTISPLSGYPVRHVVGASVVASHAMDADAIATACMVMPIADSIAMVNALDGVAARITDELGNTHYSSNWPALRLAVAPTSAAGEKQRIDARQSAEKTEVQQTRMPLLPPEQRWPNDWEIGIRYVAPDKQEDQRSADFRTPYMALWITDEQNRPIRTLTMVGRSAEWQRDNFIWWSTNRARAEQLVDIRSQATALSGRYLLYWSGMDDDWKPVPIGKYILHIETSQERGKHTYRSLPLHLGREKFKAQIPHSNESGGLEISYGHYNDRFKYAE